MAEVGNFRGLQAANKRKTFALLALFGALMWVVVYAALTYFGGSTAFIVPIAVGLSLVSVWGSYYGSDRLVLTMTGAKLITEDDNPKLFNLVHEVVIASGLPMPKVAIVVIQHQMLCYRPKSRACTDCIYYRNLDVMDRDQLQGVIAHEMSHVANRDTLVSAVAASTAGAIAILSDFLMRMMFFGGRRDSNSNSNPIALVVSLIVLIMAPIAAVLLKSAISRKRESLADATAVSFTRNPAGLRSALEVLARDSTVVQQRSTAVAHIWIESPLDANQFLSCLHPTHRSKSALQLFVRWRACLS
jgi:heat shock protein HtpX